jgi:hypothetical protein
MVHGEFRMQPDRSLIINFQTLNQYPTEEETMFKRLKELLHLELETEMEPADVAPRIHCSSFPNLKLIRITVLL